MAMKAVVDDGTIQLAHTPRALAEMTGLAPPAYRKLHQLVLNATIPAEMIRGRWYVQRAHLPAIATFLGMVPSAPAPAPQWTAPQYQPPPRPAWVAPESWGPAPDQPSRAPRRKPAPSAA